MANIEPVIPNDEFFKAWAENTAMADRLLENILSKDYQNFSQYEEVSKIENLEVSKIIIKRLLDKLQSKDEK